MKLIRIKLISNTTPGTANMSNKKVANKLSGIDIKRHTKANFLYRIIFKLFLDR